MILIDVLFFCNFKLKNVKLFPNRHVPSIKVLKATSKGRDYQYGIKTKIKVDKNHVNNITYEGEICSLQQGLWNPDKLDEYKKQYASFIKSKLEEQLQHLTFLMEKEGDRFAL